MLFGFLLLIVMGAVVIIALDGSEPLRQFFQMMAQIGRAAAWIAWGAMLVYAAASLYGVHMPGPKLPGYGGIMLP